MRFTGAVESTYPHPGLFCLPDILEVGFENMFQAFLILPFADKCLKFIAEHGKSLIGFIIVDIGRTFIDKLPCGRVF